MKPLYAIAGAVMLLGSGVASSQAGTVAIGDIGGGGPYLRNQTNPTVGNKFDDFFTFSSMLPFNVDFNLLNTGSMKGSTGVPITSISYAFYMGTVTNGAGSKTQLIANIAANPITSNTYQGFYQSTSTLAAGDYYIEMMGTTQKSSNVGNSINMGVTVSAVPLPPSLPMFGAAIIALAGVAFMRSRKVSTETGLESMAVAALLEYVPD